MQPPGGTAGQIIKTSGTYTAVWKKWREYTGRAKIGKDFAMVYLRYVRQKVVEVPYFFGYEDAIKGISG